MEEKEKISLYDWIIRIDARQIAIQEKLCELVEGLAAQGHRDETKGRQSKDEFYQQIEELSSQIYQVKKEQVEDFDPSLAAQLQNESVDDLIRRLRKKNFD